MEKMSPDLLLAGDSERLGQGPPNSGAVDHVGTGSPARKPAESERTHTRKSAPARETAPGANPGPREAFFSGKQQPQIGERSTHQNISNEKTTVK